MLIAVQASSHVWRNVFVASVFVFYFDENALEKLALKKMIFGALKNVGGGKKIDNSQVGLAIFEKIFGQFWPFLANLAKFFGKMLSET